MAVKNSNLDSILVQLGDFGKYQSLVFSLVCIAVIFHSAVHVAYVFSAMDLNYRCEVPACESDHPIFKPDWFNNAIPSNEHGNEKCLKYRFKNITNPGPSLCSIANFDRNKEEICDEYIYESPEITIVQDFDIHCDDKLWMLTMVGTINNVGQFVGLPIAGVISDKYGRRTVLIMGMVLCAIAGIARSFASSYIWFLVLEFIDAAFGSGTYAVGFVLGVELVGPKKRVLSGTIISSTYAVGEVFLAGVAWLCMSWRPMLLVLYIPPLLLLSYFWLTPESVRWLLTQGRDDEAIRVLKRAAKVNKVEISEEAFKELTTPVQEIENIEKYPIKEVLKSKTLLLRFVNSCFCWITCTFLFYGLTLNSVSLAGNPYVDFILTSLIEIPAYFATYFIVDRIGRRYSQCFSFLLTGVACLAFIFSGDENEWLRLSIWLLGKFGATFAFTVCYILTSEIFPTPLRQSLMGACSMFGRIGSMVAPQTPLLAQVWKPLPLVLFAVMGTIAGFLSLLFPETLNVKLPDTIEEAVLLGKSNDSLPTKM